MNIVSHFSRTVFIMLILPLSLLAQQEETGNWLMYFGTNKISEDFSIHTEIQYRNHTITPNNIEQLLIRTGLNYHFSTKASVTAGYAFIPSYDFESEQKSPETEEHRIWQQFILSNNLGNIKFEHRYRLEQRWVNKDYRNRFRYRIMVFIPLYKSLNEKGNLFLGVYDEIFVNGKEPFFDRNRLYGALGYQVSKNASIQAGMLNQQVNDFGKWYLQFALILNTDLRNKKN